MKNETKEAITTALLLEYADELKSAREFLKQYSRVPDCEIKWDVADGGASEKIMHIFSHGGFHDAAVDNMERIFFPRLASRFGRFAGMKCLAIDNRDGESRSFFTDVYGVCFYHCERIN